jgi:hypothetical protein
MATSNAEKIETFFPNQKKRMLLKAAGTGPVMGKDKTRRIRLALKMSLDDGKLVGMPSYIADAYNALAKDDSVMDDPKLLIELDGINVEFYATDQTKDPTIKVEGVMLHSFHVSRETVKRDGEAPPIFLYFTLKTSGWIPKLWLWLADNLNADFWMMFEGSNMTLSFVGPAKDEDEDDSGDENEGASSVEETRRRSSEAAKDLVPVAVHKPRNQMSAAQRKAADALDGKKVN